MSNLIKTVLAPNAPWPKPEPVAEPIAKPKKKKPPVAWRNQNAPELDLEALDKKYGVKKAQKVNLESSNVDFFAQTHAELHHIKNTPLPRARDKLSGRFKGSQRMAG